MKSGDTVIYTSPKTGRQTEVVILDISPAGAKVAQVADRSKVLDCRTSCLKTREQMTERAAQDAAERQKRIGGAFAAQGMSITLAAAPIASDLMSAARDAAAQVQRQKQKRGSDARLLEPSPARQI